MECPNCGKQMVHDDLPAPCSVEAGDQRRHWWCACGYTEPAWGNARERWKQANTKSSVAPL